MVEGVQTTSVCPLASICTLHRHVHTHKINTILNGRGTEMNKTEMEKDMKNP